MLLSISMYFERRKRLRILFAHPRPFRTMRNINISPSRPSPASYVAQGLVSASRRTNICTYFTISPARVLWGDGKFQFIVQDPGIITGEIQ